MRSVGSRSSGQQASIKANAEQHFALETKDVRDFKHFTTESVKGLDLNVSPIDLSSSLIFPTDKLRAMAVLKTPSFVTFPRHSKKNPRRLLGKWRACSPKNAD